MNNAGHEPLQEVLGLFELDLSGKVVYCLSKSTRSHVLNRKYIGVNLFRDVELFSRQEVFRRQFERFANSGASIENLKLSCPFDNEIFNLRVLMVRAASNTQPNNSQKTILLYVRED